MTSHLEKMLREARLRSMTLDQWLNNYEDGKISKEDALGFAVVQILSSYPKPTVPQPKPWTRKMRK